MKGTPMTLQQRRMLCKTVATSDGCLDDYFRLWRQGRKLYPAYDYDSEKNLTCYIEKNLAKVLYQNYKMKRSY